MKKIEDMTLREKIGQLLVVGFPADGLDQMVELIEEYKIGNVILFKHNIQDAKTLFEINQKLQKASLAKSGIPLYISIDQEGGMVTRIMKDATFFPGNMTLGATQNSENARLVGEMMGQELFNLGINMNLAPVLDVNNNPKNPVIGVRSYSDAPEQVAEFGAKFVEGLQKQNVLATAKHFPGHGDTSVDSHLDLTSVNHLKDRLKDVELYPFKKAIEANIQAIMSAHVLFPAYEDENLPATLSKNVLTGLLRDELGFEGLIVTDCMEMKAIDTYYQTEKAAVKALEAGANLIFISHRKERQIGALEEIEKAVQDGRLSEELINERLTRVLKAKERVKDDVVAFTQLSFGEAKEQIIVPSHREFAQKTADSALTLVSGTRFDSPEKNTLFIAPKPKATTIADDKVDQGSLLEAVKAQFPEWTTFEIAVNPSEEVIEELVNKVDEFEQVVVSSYNANIYLAQRELLERLSKKVPGLHVIVLRNPYDIIGLDVNGVLTYEYSTLTLNTVIKYLKGDLIPQGKSPVRL